MTQIGISNEEREPVEKKEPTHEWIPICGSEVCTAKYYRERRSGMAPKARGAKKNVKYRETFCPDCGCALYWRRKEIKKGRKNGITKEQEVKEG